MSGWLRVSLMRFALGPFILRWSMPRSRELASRVGATLHSARAISCFKGA